MRSAKVSLRWGRPAALALLGILLAAGVAAALDVSPILARWSRTQAFKNDLDGKLDVTATYFAGEYVEARLFNHIVVAVALVAGGAVLVAVDRRGNGGSRIRSVGGIGCGTAFLVGLIQCVAMVPGVSRSAATIIGAMALGASRVAAAEFSFFLAVPTMVAASAYALARHGFVLSNGEALALAVGFAVSFAVALAVVAGFMRFISTRNFRPFGYYRIALGIAVLAYWYCTAGG